MDTKLIVIVLCLSVLSIFVGAQEGTADEDDDFFTDPEDGETKEQNDCFDKGTCTPDQHKLGMANPQVRPELKDKEAGRVNILPVDEPEDSEDSDEGTPNSDGPPTSGGSTMGPDVVASIPPLHLNFFSPRNIDSIAEKLTPVQIRSLSPAIIPLLSPNTIRIIAKDLLLTQLMQLTSRQVQALSADELMIVLSHLPPGPQRENFLAKLSDAQLLNLVKKFPDVGSLPPDVAQRYVQLINKNVELVVGEGSKALFNDTVVESNTLKLDIDSMKGEFVLAVTKEGFQIATETGGTFVAVHPYTEEPILFTLPPNGTVELELTPELEFEVKLSEYVDFQVISPDASTVHLYSKTDHTVATLNADGEYTITNAILTYTSPYHKESLDTEGPTTISLDRRIGFGCMLMSYGANYTLDQNEITQGVLAQTFPMYLCVRTSEAVDEQYFSLLQQQISSSGIPFNMLDSVIDKTLFTAPLFYRLQGAFVYEHGNDQQATNLNGKLSTNAASLSANGIFVLEEKNSRRYFRYITFSMAQYLQTYSSSSAPDISFIYPQTCSLNSPCKVLTSSFIQRGTKSKVTAYDQPEAIVTDHFRSAFEPYGVFLS